MHRHTLLLVTWLTWSVACSSEPSGPEPSDAAADASEDASALDAGEDAMDGGGDPDAGDTDATIDAEPDGTSPGDAEADAGDADAGPDADAADAADAGDPEDTGSEPSCAGDAAALRQAVVDAAPGATVQICAGSYEVSLYVNQDLTLVGSGADTTRLSSPTSDPVLVVADDAAVRVEGVTFHDATGGAISASAAGPLSVRDCVFEDNSAPQGAGIHGPMAALLTLEHVRLSRNAASSAGGAIYAHQVEADDVRVLDNTATAQTGGVLLVGDAAALTMRDSVFEGNTNGALVAGRATLTDTVFRDNDSGARSAVSLHSGTLAGVVFDGNRTSETGAALRITAAPAGQPEASVMLVNGTLVNNTSGYLGAVYIGGDDGDVVTFSSVDSDWGSEEDDNTPLDVAVHEYGVDNWRYAFGADASFTCTFSSRACM